MAADEHQELFVIIRVLCIFAQRYEQPLNLALYGVYIGSALGS
jgi:hypothetical protein